MIRLLTEEASQHKRNNEDEILAAFQALDADKKGYLEKVSFGCSSQNNSQPNQLKGRPSLFDPISDVVLNCVG